MRVLITGSEGKIGKETVKVLGDHELLLVDKKGGASVKCDLSKDDLTFIKDFKPEVIIHLAASFERTDETPLFYNINFRDNILATYNLNKLIASFDYCPDQYIYASSYLVYDPMLYLTPRPTKAPTLLAECSDLNPRNLIGAAKLYGEKEIEFLKRNIHQNMRVVHARIFRVFGEGGQEFVSRVLEWKKLGIPVQVWNTENKFDYIHTSDCAEALKALIGHEGVYNVGRGVATSIKQIINAVNPKTTLITKPDDYESSCADTYDIEERVGWTAKVNVLDWIASKL